MDGSGPTRYRVRRAETGTDLVRAQRLRGRCFGAGGRARDRDGFDVACAHVLIEAADTGDLAATFRLLTLPDGAAIGESYSAQFYDLGRLVRYPRPAVEMGRFCIAPGRADPEIMRLALSAVACEVERAGAGLIFGCASFRGTDARPYREAFAMLRVRHLAPGHWRPGARSPDIYPFARRLRHTPDPVAALRAMPTLLRGYLALGGWVSDHAVIDRDLGTLHVFTGLEVGAIPDVRARALRRGAAALAGAA